MKCPTCNGTGLKPNQKEIGVALRGLRFEAGVGLRPMARLLGISHSYLSQLESGKRKWGRSLIDRYEKETREYERRNQKR